MILDTNALSALAGRDPAIIQQLSSAPILDVPFVTLGEYLYGLRRSQFQNQLESWLQAFLKGVDVTYPNEEILSIYADLRVELREAGTPIPANDVWIAAIVRYRNMPLVSRDAHFDHVRLLRRVEW